ncbi:MAG: hypothetical protein IPL48_13610 [Bacteroidetes bacterium]|nr:hypothetical protein [Bacteroidota bacterium]
MNKKNMEAKEILGRKTTRTHKSTYKKLALQWLNDPDNNRDVLRNKFSAGRQFSASKSPTS